MYYSFSTLIFVCALNIAARMLHFWTTRQCGGTDCTGLGLGLGFMLVI